MRTIVSALFMAVSFTAFAQTKTVHVQDPGTISLEIPADEKNTITDLTVTGDLNGTDILYIIQMAGTTVYHDSETTPGTLKHLDMSGANIVAGGVKYSQWPNYSTVDNQVGSNMFKYTYLETIKLPESAVLIGDNAFSDCSKLQSVTIPSTVQSIGSYAFNNCPLLANVTLPEGITALKDATFMNCKALTGVEIPTTVTSIGGNVFNGCTFTKLTIPASVTSIGYDAFCSSLTELHVAATVVPTAGFRAFNCVDVANCTLYVPVGMVAAYRAADQWSAFVNIVEEQAAPAVVTEKEVTLTEAGTLANFINADEKTTIQTLKVSGPFNALDLRLVREMAGSDEHFQSTGGQLTSLDLTDANIVADPDLYYAIHPSSVPENPVYLTIWSELTDCNNMIPAMAFEGCNIEHIDMPASLKTIASAFVGCPLKGTVVIPEGVTHIRDYAFQNCAEIEEVVLPSTLRNVGSEDYYYPNALGAHVFEGCSKLSAINIPAGVTLIPTNAFERTGFTEFTIPATVKTIASRAFANMPSLNKLTSESAVPPTAQYGAFADVNYKSVTLVVPDGSEDLYKAADEWCYFFGTTGINGIRGDKKSPVYDLNGRSVNGEYKGIRIQNGKKIL